MNATDKALMQETDEGLVQLRLRDFPEDRRLMILASVQGDLSPLLTEDQLTDIGGNCVQDYERDLTDREDWEKKVKEAFKRAAQEKLDAKKFPWDGAANINYPLLTTATIQFAARAIGAIVKGDEVVTCKVVGKDKGKPELGPDGQPLMQVNGLILQMTPTGPALVNPQDGTGQMIPPEQMPQVMEAAQPVWKVPPGFKTKRAMRVAEYLNTVFFYRMKGWEADTDTLLHQLPIAGCAFRKVWPSRGEQRSAFVPALKMVVPMTAKDCDTAPRMTEEIDDKPLNDIIGLQRAEFYRDVRLVADDDSDAPRKLLEQHCRIDLDDDGYAEPYIVTLDHQTATVLRIEADYGPEQVETNQYGEVISIPRRSYYVKYDFLPSFDGSFYGIGLGHLLDEIGTVVNMAVNQMIDAGTAQAAGGGFIGSGVNLQNGKRTSVLRFRPGEYKTVSASGTSLREAIYERTFPGPNPVTFQVLELMLGAAREIASIKDVLTGDAKNTGQVGTTLALIEQGLQVYTSIQGRVNRAVKTEATLVFENIAAYGGEAAAADYIELLDDPEADFERDFNQKDMDIRPVRDPSSVTNVQRLAKANFLTQYISAPGINPQEIMRRSFEAANIDDIDDLFMPQQQPDPLMIAAAEADVAGKQAKAMLDGERAQTEAAKRGEMAASAQRDQGRLALEALAEGARQGFGQG